MSLLLKVLEFHSDIHVRNIKGKIFGLQQRYARIKVTHRDTPIRLVIAVY